MDGTVTTPLLFFESNGIRSKTERVIAKGSNSISYLWIGLQGRSTGMVSYREHQEFEVFSLIKLNACQPWQINNGRFKRLSTKQAQRIQECLKEAGIDILVFLQ